MSKFKLLFLAIAIFALTATSALAASSCESAVAILQSALEKAESEGSDGKIETCLPAKNPEKSTGKILKALQAVSVGYAEANARINAIDARLQKLKAVVAEKGACNAGRQWLTDNNALKAELAKPVLDGRGLSQLQYDFKGQYAGRKAAGNVGVRPFRSFQCRKAEQSVVKVMRLFEEASHECENFERPVSSAFNLIEFWEEQRKSGCTITQKCERTNVGQGSYQVDYLNEDGEWRRWEQGEFEFEEASKLVDKCEFAGPRQERNKPDSGGEEIENPGENADSGTRGAQ